MTSPLNKNQGSHFYLVFVLGLLYPSPSKPLKMVVVSSLHQRYLTCMNWAFAQLGVGSSSAKPVNSLEAGHRPSAVIFPLPLVNEHSYGKALFS